MPFVKVYRNTTPLVRAVEKQLGAYKPGTRSLAIPQQITRADGRSTAQKRQKPIGAYQLASGGEGRTRFEQRLERDSQSQKRPTLAAGVLEALRKKRAEGRSAAVTGTKRQRTKTPSALDDLMGCDELSCMLDDCMLDDFIDDVGGFVKKVGKTIVNAFDTLMDNPVFKAVFPIVALANSDIGLKIGGAIPGVGNVVGLGQSIKAWAKSSNVSLPPDVAAWASNAAGGLTSAIPPEVSAWAKSAIPPEAIAAAKKAGVDLSPLKNAPSKGVDLVGMLNEGLAKGQKIMTAFDVALNEGIANARAEEAARLAKLAASASPPPTVVSQPQLALAAPVPMATVPAGQQSVNLSVAPYGSSPGTAAVASQLEQQFGKSISDIASQVRLTSLQMQATSEHNALVKKARFERKLLTGLQQIAANTKR